MSAQSDVTSPAEIEKKIKLSCAAAAPAQLHCIVRLKKMEDYNTAFKCATIMYAQEYEKGETGMSARNVVDLIRNKCKVKLCPRTIQKKSRKELLEVCH